MENKNSRQEKRDARRIQKSLIIQFSLESSDPLARKWDISSINDISESGVSFSAGGKFHSGAVMQMLIKIPLRPFEWFEVSGKVVAAEESKTKNEDPEYKVYLVRVAFLSLEEEQKKLIREYIAWYLSKDGGKK
jgi:hypothetical protein